MSGGLRAPIAAGRPAGLVVLLALLSCLWACSGSSDSPNAASPEYLSLLARFPAESQGRGVDPYEPETVSDHPMTYGLVLSSESLRHSASPDGESANRVRLAARWLIDHSDLDGDGKKGWGLPFAWDAFGDGSVNPADHPYSITTAIVLLGFLDALDTRGIWSEEERREIFLLVKNVFERWCAECWTQVSGSTGYFWYSPAAADAHYLPNITSMVSGALQRFAHDHEGGLAPAEAEYFRGRAAQGIARVESSVVPLDGMPFWNYIDSGGFSAYPNDLVHHSYILYGIHLFRENGGNVPVRWTDEDALRSVRLFSAAGVAYNYPHDPFFAGGLIDPDQPANLWGVGMAIAYASARGDAALADSLVGRVTESYGDYPDVTIFPLYWSADERFYPRYAAHVLFGIAVRDFSAN